MDFIEKLHLSQGYAVYKFTKMGHFLPLTHRFSAAFVARLFLDHIFKLHSFLDSIVTDRDKTFQVTFGGNFSSSRAHNCTSS